MDLQGSKKEEELVTLIHESESDFDESENKKDDSQTPSEGKSSVSSALVLQLSRSNAQEIVIDIDPTSVEPKKLNEEKFENYENIKNNSHSPSEDKGPVSSALMLQPSTSNAQYIDSTSVKQNKLYEELLFLESKDFVENEEHFKCTQCQTDCEPKVGLVLTECIHTICKACISKMVEMTDDVEIICPYQNDEYSCDKVIPHREIKNCVNKEVFDKFIIRSLSISNKPSSTQLVHTDIIQQRKKFRSSLYDELIALEDMAIVENKKPFECQICLTICQVKSGIVLTECLHSFCKDCISIMVKMANDVEILCPFRNREYSCEKTILHCEIREIVGPKSFEKFLQRSFSMSMERQKDFIKCQTPDCLSWIYKEENMQCSDCIICGAKNCHLCKGLHDPKVLSCLFYKQTLNDPSSFSENVLKEMINNKQGMECPSCRSVIEKISGCDGIQCSRCKTEICWATRGPRWGPNGPGDTSGGCRCNINGQRCHPGCNNCH